MPILWPYIKPHEQMSKNCEKCGCRVEAPQLNERTNELLCANCFKLTELDFKLEQIKSDFTLKRRIYFEFSTAHLLKEPA